MKMYMPNQLINNNYYYEVYDDYYLVKTNISCFSQYNSTYCNCLRVYYKNNYMVTSPYSCSISSNQYTIQNVQWVDDWFYRYDLFYIISIIFMLFFLIWYIAKVILKAVGLNA